MTAGDQLEARLEQTLSGRAAQIDALPSFTADDLILAGRRTRARRRRNGLAAVVVVVAVASIAGVVLGNRGQAGPPPLPAATTATPSPSVTPTGPAVANSVPVASVRLNVVAGTSIDPWDAAPFTVDLPAGYALSDGARVPGGWVVEAYQDPTGFALWFVPDSGSPRSIGTIFGNWAVSADGHTLVAAGLSGTPNVVAYRLPSLAVLATTQFNHGTGPVVLGVTGSQALLKAASGDGSPTVAGRWNITTNQVRTTDKDIDVWGMTNDGQVLRRVSPSGASPTSACVALVPLAGTAFTHVTQSGLCSGDMAGPGVRGLVSPDGAQVVVSRFGTAPLLARVADMAAGRWRPEPLDVPADSQILFWDTPTSFVATADNRFARCDGPVTCVTLGLPAGLTDPHLLPNRGR